jgi:hypothetical protein
MRAIIRRLRRVEEQLTLHGHKTEPWNLGERILATRRWRFQANGQPVDQLPTRPHSGRLAWDLIERLRRARARAEKHKQDHGGDSDRKNGAWLT